MRHVIPTKKKLNKLNPMRVTTSTSEDGCESATSKLVT